MFRGRSDQTIDEKGRIIMPAKFREVLSKRQDPTIMLTNLDMCLIGYPVEEWAELERKILSRPDTSDTVKNFKRFLIGGVSECCIDKQGRILVPPSLKKYAQLEKNVVIVGLIDHFEIWNAERFYSIVQQEESFGQSEELRMFRHDVGL
ncbi:MAG: division/cell wall cluster transcriptional repressor MraZ [Desulfobacterota bacterium]|nr:division/cell wall cluster transcriptional repressor MraZ [Thermodesulfobacteriota bacterium]